MEKMKSKFTSFIFASLLVNTLGLTLAHSTEPTSKRKYPEIDISQVDTDEEATSVYLQLLAREDDLEDDLIDLAIKKSRQLTKVKKLNEQYQNTNDAVIRASIRKKVRSANKIVKRLNDSRKDTKRQLAVNENKKAALETDYPYLNLGDWFL